MKFFQALGYLLICYFGNVTFEKYMTTGENLYIPVILGILFVYFGYNVARNLYLETSELNKIFVNVLMVISLIGCIVALIFHSETPALYSGVLSGIMGLFFVGMKIYDNAKIREYIWVKCFIIKDKLKRKKEYARYIRHVCREYYNENHLSSISMMEVSKIDVFDSKNKLCLVFHLARPGILIGRKGEDIDAFRKYLSEYFNKTVEIKIKEVEIW